MHKEDQLALQCLILQSQLHKGVPGSKPKKPLINKDLLASGVDPEDVKLLKSLDSADRKHIYELCRATADLSIDCLLHQTCAFVACLIKGQPVDKLPGILTPVANAGV